ncbi:hypothetical protein NPIL_238611 [Nephila pilipes]|uniref:Uncharacterized protein n=1 Tax=Nephila pilipes TaxID=299642 RepID=A0A8X6MN72_NEPPI|nr:hypothetical protein NPIL_238611 [Nephila pilipes]
MCPDECFAELWMVSPVSLESRLSRPLEPLRSDLRPWKPLDGSRALGFFSRLLGLSVRFRLSKCRPFSRVLCLVFVCCASSPVLKTSTRRVFLSCCVLWTFMTTDFHLGPFVPKIYMTL